MIQKLKQNLLETQVYVLYARAGKNKNLTLSPKKKINDIVHLFN